MRLRHLFLALAFWASWAGLSLAAPLGVDVAVLQSPCAYPGSALYFNFQTNAAQINCQNGGLATGQLSITRATVGLAQWQSGRWQSFASGAFRITDNGLLVEEARTNIVTQSIAFDNAAWMKTDVTVTADNTTAPDGTLTADLLTEGSAGTAITFSTFGTITASVPTSGSIFVKRGNTDWIRLILSDSTILNGGQVWANLSTGVLGTVSVRGTGSGFSATISASINGFYRITLSGTIAALTTGLVTINSASADNSSTRVNGATYYAWNGQIEANAAFATSPILTTNAAVTRNADVVQVIGPGATIIPLSASAFFQTFGQEGITATPRLLGLGSDALNNSGSTSINANDGTNNVAATLGTGSFGGLVKAAFGLDNTSMTAIANDGTKVIQATSVWATNAAGQTPYLGNTSSANRAFNGYLQRAAFGIPKGIFDNRSSP